MQEKNRGRGAVLALLVLVTVFALAGCAKGGKGEATAQKDAGTEPKEAKLQFPSRDITFIVPVSPGGGFDTYARILAPFLKKYLPGQPNVVVKNVPGGEWRLGIMEMYKAQPDGHTICIFNIPGNVVSQIIGQAEYDLTKVAWIGRITDSVYVAALSPKSKYRTLDDLRKAPKVKFGTVGVASSSSLAVIISAKEMGFKVEPVSYDGSSEAILGAVKGEVDYVTYQFPSLRKFIVDSKELIPFVVYAKERLKELPDTPTIGELGYEKLLDVVTIDYMVGTTPGTLQEILRVWREAFDKAVADPEFVAMMQEQLKYRPNPLNGDQAALRVNNVLKIYAEYKDLLLEYAAKK